jgi:hypothetical protein
LEEKAPQGSAYKKSLKWIFAASAGLIVGPALLSYGVNSVPSTVSDSFDKYLEENNVGSSFLEEIENKDIKVFKRDSALIPFYFAGLYLKNQTEAIMDYEDANFIEKMGALSILYTFEHASVLEQLYANINDIKDSGTFAEAQINLATKECMIFGPENKQSAEIISDISRIPLDDIRKFNIDDDLLFSFIVRHEASHCDFYSEAGADLFAVRTIENETANDEVRDIIKYMRAVAPFAWDRDEFLYDSHAVAVNLDKAEQGSSFYFQNILAAGNKSLHDLVKEKVVQKPGEEYYLAVYRTLKEMLDNRKVYGTVTRQAAELYVEGVEYLAPDAAEKSLTTAQSANPLRREQTLSF